MDCVAEPVWVVDHHGGRAARQPGGDRHPGVRRRVRAPGSKRARHGPLQAPGPHPVPGRRVPRHPARHDRRARARRSRTGSSAGTARCSPSRTPLSRSTCRAGRGVVVTFVDMTAQRQAEQALRERDAILARVEQPVWVVDHRGRFRYANPAALAALGYEHPSELVGRPGHDTVHYKHPDGTPYPEEDCRVAQARHAGATRCTSARTGSCARTGRSCGSPTRPRPSSCLTGSAR